MEKWGFAIISFGLFLLTMASMQAPVNLLTLFSGFFYIVLGVWMYVYGKKKNNNKRGAACKSSKR